MGLFSRRSVPDSPEAITEADYATVPIDGEIARLLSGGRDAPGCADLPNALQLRPSRTHGGIEDARSFIQSVHDARSHNGENVSAPMAWEIRYSQGRLSFHDVPGTPHHVANHRSQFETAYGGAEITLEPPTLLPAHENNWGSPSASRSERRGGSETTATGWHLAGATLDFAMPTESVRPIKHLELDGFDMGDPYAEVLKAMVYAAGEHGGNDPAEAVIQVSMRPELAGWTDGGSADQPSINDIAEQLREPTIEFRRNQNALLKHVPLLFNENVEVPASKKEKRAATIIRNLANTDGWAINVRIFVASPNPTLCRDRTHQVARMFRKYYESSTGQGFVPHPLGAKALKQEVGRAARREFVDRDQPLYLCANELIGLTHLPNSDVEIEAIEWTFSGVTRGVPVGTPRFDFEAAGVDPATDPPEAQQVAMLEQTANDAPYYFGRGIKRGVEAGIRADLVDVHKSVNGSTGAGKTNLLMKDWRQIVSRDTASEMDGSEMDGSVGDGSNTGTDKQGAAYIDPKGDGDAKKAVWHAVQAGRAEDIVYLEIGGGRDQIVGINFLEAVGGLEPGDPGFADAIEPTAEDFCALLDEAGGEGKFGTRMERITKNIVRGLARLSDDRQVMPLDVHFAVDDSERYADLMAEERIEWIRDYAENHLRDMDDQDKEPIAGRIQQLVENDITRELLSFPESTVSIEDIVADGNLLIVNCQTSSTTALQLISTAVIRRLWVAIREQTYSDDRPDPDQFFVTIDEFQQTVTDSSTVHEILAEARSFGLSLTLACQNPSTQLPDRISSAIQNQCRTFLSLNPGGPDDADVVAKQHSGIDAEDLTRLPPYRLFMRTLTDRNELTESYPVDVFSPLPGEEPEDADLDAVVEPVIEASLDRYGGDRRADEEAVKGSSLFFGESDTDADAELLTSDTRPAAYKAIYDRQLIHSDDPIDPGPIPFDVLADALQTALVAEDETLHDGQVQSMKDTLKREHLTETVRDGDYYYAVAPAGRTFLDQGESPTAGRQHHRDGVDDAYHHLVHWLPECEVSIPDQGGSSDLPDLAIRDPFELSGSALSVEKQRSQFESEYPLRAVLTQGADTRVEFEWSTKEKSQSLIKKVTRAYRRDEACLFVVWSVEDARKVHGHLTTPDARQEVPDDALWNIAVLPPAQADFETPQLFVGPSLPRDATADSESTLLPFDSVSPQAVADAQLESHSEFSLDLSDVDI